MPNICTLSARFKSHVPLFVNAAAVSVTLLDEPNQPASTTNYVTISGLNFESTNVTPSAYAVGAACLTTAWTSATTAQCRHGTNNIGSFQMPSSGELWIKVRTSLSQAHTGM